MENQTDALLTSKVYTSVTVYNDAGTRISVKYDTDDETVGIFLHNSYICFPRNAWLQLVEMADSVIPARCETHN